MCLLAVHARFSSQVPLLLAANREEAYARPSRPPEIQRDQPAVLCGTDVTAGGTWLGVNAAGLTAAVTNRRKQLVPLNPRSRGTLCRELLRCANVAEAAALAEDELRSGQYNGANYFLADRTSACVIHGGDVLERIDLPPGLHLLTNADVNDPADRRQRLARRMLAAPGYAAKTGSATAAFVAAARTVCAHSAITTSQPAASAVAESADDLADVSIILRGAERGTVSSTILTLTEDKAGLQYLFAPGAPDQTDYIDFTDRLRWVLN